MNLSLKILRKCALLLQRDPSGADCCQFLASLKLRRDRTDEYFRQAEALAYPDSTLTEGEVIANVFRGLL